MKAVTSPTTVTANLLIYGTAKTTVLSQAAITFTKRPTARGGIENAISNSVFTAPGKQAVLTATELPLKEGLIEEQYLFGQTLAFPDAKLGIKIFMELGGQTREVEINLPGITEEFIKRVEDERAEQ